MDRSDRVEQLQKLNAMLLKDLPQYAAEAQAFPPEETAQRHLLRSLMNLRPPLPLQKDFLALQDALLSREREEKGIVSALSLPCTAADPRLCLWRGDITRAWPPTPSSTRRTALCWAVLFPATAASTMPSTPPQGCSCATPVTA